MLFRPLKAAKSPVSLAQFIEWDKKYGLFPLLASNKIDGIRGLTRNGQMLSCALKPIPSQFAQTLARTLGDNFDGELISVKGPTETYSDVMTQGCSSTLHYHLFDYVDDSNLNMPFEMRQAHLKKRMDELSKTVPLDHVHILGQQLVTCIEDLINVEAIALDNGFEGLVLRDPKGIYKTGRSTVKDRISLKLVRYATSEAKVTGYEELYHNNNTPITNETGYTKRSSVASGMSQAGSLGALIVEDIYSGVALKLGTGLDSAQRDHIWSNPEAYLGKICKYKFKPYGTKNAPRQPRFLCWRSPLDISEA